MRISISFGVCACALPLPDNGYSHTFCTVKISKAVNAHTFWGYALRSQQKINRICLCFCFVFAIRLFFFSVYALRERRQIVILNPRIHLQNWNFPKLLNIKAPMEWLELGYWSSNMQINGLNVNWIEYKNKLNTGFHGRNIWPKNTFHLNVRERKIRAQNTRTHSQMNLVSLSNRCYTISNDWSLSNTIAVLSDIYIYMYMYIFDDKILTKSHFDHFCPKINAVVVLAQHSKQGDSNVNNIKTMANRSSETNHRR